MRVVEPNQPKRHMAPKKRKKRSILPVFFVFAATATILIAGYFGYNLLNKNDEAKNSNKQTPETYVDNTPKPTKIKTFSGAEFAELYNSFAYPNTQAIDEETPITGNKEADMRIRKIAEDRGYRLRSAPVTNTFTEVQNGMELQQRAVQPWLDMQKAAKADGETISLTAAYRSADDQRDIFMARLQAEGISIDSIANGFADEKVDQLLRKTAVPGYSRHHTGYTIDIACDDQPDLRFGSSTCFDWISKNNYENAKKFGWIPSYPDGAGEQGPDPEPWEYVWVGVEAVSE